MTNKNTTFRRGLLGAALAMAATAASAQADFSYSGVLDFSYGRFEPAGTYRQHRFNSNSMSASFVNVTGKYGLDGGWTPGITLETFLRFQDFKTGRRDSDPLLSRNAFVFLQSNYGLVRVGRLQSLLFDTTNRFNAFGNSVAFGPALRHIFLSGEIEGVQGDFYWNRSVGYTSPVIEGMTFNAIYGKGSTGPSGDLTGANVVFSRGLFAASLSVQDVRIPIDFNTPTKERTYQGGATYNFGFLRLFGLYTQMQDKGLDIRSKSGSTGVSVPLGPGRVLLQIAQTKADGPAINRKHTSTSGGYLYEYDSVTDIYLVAMDDRVRGQTRGVSVATGVRWRF